MNKAIAFVKKKTNNENDVTPILHYTQKGPYLLYAIPKRLYEDRAKRVYNYVLLSNVYITLYYTVIEYTYK